MDGTASQHLASPWLTGLVAGRPWSVATLAWPTRAARRRRSVGPNRRSSPLRSPRPGCRGTLTGPEGCHQDLGGPHRGEAHTPRVSRAGIATRCSAVAGSSAGVAAALALPARAASRAAPPLSDQLGAADVRHAGRRGGGPAAQPAGSAPGLVDRAQLGGRAELRDGAVRLVPNRDVTGREEERLACVNGLSSRSAKG